MTATAELGATLIRRRVNGPSDTMIDCIAANVGLVKASRWADYPAQAYVTGGPPIEWSEAQIMSFPRHIRTAQSPVIGVDDVTTARELDVETFAATPEDWPDFWESRSESNKHRATCYCSLIRVPAVIAACRNADVPPPPRFRLAWWWKNEPGVPIPDDQIVPAPTLAEVLAELERLTGLTLPPQVVWGCQYVNHVHWDLTKVYGLPDYARI